MSLVAIRLLLAIALIVTLFALVQSVTQPLAEGQTPDGWSWNGPGD